MKKVKQEITPKPIIELEDRISVWRETRKFRGPMPASLWDEAVRLAKRYGVQIISKTLGLGYSNLKNRIVKKSVDKVRVSKVTKSDGFVDISSIAQSSGILKTGFEIEMFRNDGSRVVIKNAGAECVSGVASVFFS